MHVEVISDVTEIEGWPARRPMARLASRCAHPQRHRRPRRCSTRTRAERYHGQRRTGQWAQRQAAGEPFTMTTVVSVAYARYARQYAFLIPAADAAQW